MLAEAGSGMALLLQLGQMDMNIAVFVLSLHNLCHEATSDIAKSLSATNIEHCLQPWCEQVRFIELLNPML